MNDKVILSFLLIKLKQILRAPRMWGGLESIELQCLQLLSICCFIIGKEVNICQDYVQFLNKRFDRNFNSLLSTHLIDVFSNDVDFDDFCINCLTNCLRDYRVELLGNSI